ncbi:unnamed protein product [Onchocerca ochengi]|uniref:SHSP domain-containing protein n=1 Tax=Onchocerca ochengi TaxID=42157 RepID=A0A182DXJ1_ONCOC|nr:unnamed protein product [Onchocerca ochengi]
MSRIYNSDEYYRKVKSAGNSLERDDTKWNRHKNLMQKSDAQQRHVTSMPVAYIARPSYRLIEDDLWQSGRSKQSNGYKASSSGPIYRSAKPSNTTSQSDHLRRCSPQISSSTGDIINTEHGFTIQLDTRHFQPRDIQITLHQHTLSVIGDCLEDDGTGAQKLRRSFTRKYTIPPDVRLSSISSYLTNNGYLIIKGSRKGWKETDLTEHLASSSISNESMISAV